MFIALESVFGYWAIEVLANCFLVNNSKLNEQRCFVSFTGNCFKQVKGFGIGRLLVGLHLSKFDMCCYERDWIDEDENFKMNFGYEDVNFVKYMVKTHFIKVLHFYCFMMNYDESLKGELFQLARVFSIIWFLIAIISLLNR